MEDKPQFKAIIFDMDGLLIDSEGYWDECSVPLFANRGIEFSAELKQRLTGRSLRENIEWLKQQYGWTEPTEDLIKEFRTATDHIYYNLAQPLPGASELIKKVDSAFSKQAIASGSFLYRIEEIANRFAWTPYFDALISSDHVNYVGKPDPAIYRFTANELRVLPETCVVLEDSVNGVRAAKAAGMTCIAVPNQKWGYGDFSMADMIVESLEDERIRKFLKIK